MSENFEARIKQLEDDLAFLKAEQTLVEYTLANNVENYPDYIMDAARTVQQYIENKVGMFEKALGNLESN